MALANPRSSRTLIFLVCQLILSTSALPLQAAETPSAATDTHIADSVMKNDGVDGIASYYAKRYNGRKTCSGPRYDPEKLSAAHHSLPFGTRVRVVNLSNDREVTVTVNDRCRKKGFPFIDLSRAAARKLGFLGKGTAKVRIIPLDATDESS